MSQRSSPARVALIGYGFAGRVFHAPLIGAIAGLSLDVVASRDADKVHADLPGVEVVNNYLQAATDPRIDLVVIASPNDSHAALARAALQAGRNVVVDKPFTLSLDEARELAALARTSGRLLSVFHNRRWDTDYLAVRSVVESGAIGEVVHFESHIDRYRPEVRRRWREQEHSGGGVLWDLGPHLIDQTMQLMGRPDHVMASVARQREGAQADDWAHVVLGYGERRAVLHSGMLATGGSPRFLVHGTRGSVVKQQADPQESQLIAGLRPGDPGWGVDGDDLLLLEDGQPARPVQTPAGDQSRYYAEIQQALLGTGANPVPPEQAVEVMAVLEAAMVSARERRQVVPRFKQG